MTEDQRRAIEADCERLIKRYFHLGDAGDWAAMAELYAEDGRMIRPSGGAALEGRAAILAAFLARPARAQRHTVSNVLVEVDDADHARASSVIVLYFGDLGSPGEVPSQNAASPMVGSYTDKLVRTAEGWRFAERIGALDFRP